MRIKKLFAGLTIALVLSVPFVASHSAAALFENSKSAACEGIALSSSNGCKAGKKDLTIDKVIKDVVNLLSLVVGIISVIMIMIGGFKYVTSRGDSGGVEGAKSTILYAVIGLVVVAMAQAIVKFVLAKVTK